MATRDSKSPDLERSLALLWSGRAGGRRGPRPKLSVEQIAQAAIRVADADGLEALSMQRIAAELGYSTMSLYNHIPSKDLLLEVAADIGAGQPPEIDGTADFRDAVRQWVAALWAGFQTRPWILRVPIDHSPIGPNQLAWLDRLLRPLLAAGLAGGQARAAAMHLTAVVRGTAQISVDLAKSHQTSAAELGRLLDEVIDERAYPALVAVHAAEAVETAETAEHEGHGLPVELDFGVNRFLDGVEAWVASHGKGRSSGAM
ncbi:TetR/AcrR family transcriptional regulator [Amycolatopsis magusensis]|uniref:AcrR family transcriptional regulator n=1 Tax=Amycolatopsis magusensis TaxID=882444 RepID=A0ABS4Q1L1_9PSEU|nr:TetR/AcrR family transcriptional regulator [Amycolatopsis magusensis]MBP2185556.1 AcrR family transcriptional regulator [Amycolatopsis magusensis]